MAESQKLGQIIQMLQAEREGGEIQDWEQVSKLSPTSNARAQSINQC